MIGLVFDIDGVVADTESVNAAVSVEVFRDLCGIKVKAEDFRPFLGTGDTRYMTGVAERYGVEIDPERATALRQEKFLAVLARDGMAPYPGVIDLMTAARDADDVGLAIATSGNKAKQFPVLEAIRADRGWFDVVITGDDVTRKKPDPQIYLLTAERLGLAPGRCVVIEDAPAGVAAAKGAGMACIAVTNTVDARALAGADRIVRTLDEIALADVRALAHS